MSLILDIHRDLQREEAAKQPQRSAILQAHDDLQRRPANPRELLMGETPMPAPKQDAALVRGAKTVGHGLQYAQDMTARDYAGAAQGIREATEYQRRNPGTPASQDLQKIWQDSGGGFAGVGKGVKGIASEFAKDWREAPSIQDKLLSTGQNVKALGTGVVAQMPNMVLPMAGMLAGGLGGAAAGSAIPGVGNVAGAAVGGWAGASAGNTLVEGQHIALHALDKAGIDPLDTPRVAKYLEENSGTLFGQAVTKGSIIGLVDTLTAGLGAKILTAPGRAAANRTLMDMGVDVTDNAAVQAAKGTVEFKARYLADPGLQASQTGARNLGRNASVAALDPAGEFTGEYVGSGVALGEWDEKDAFLEAVSSVGQSAVMFAGQKGYQAATDPLLAGAEARGEASEEALQRNESILAIKKANLPTHDLTTMRDDPGALARYNLAPQDIDAVLADRSDDLSRAKMALLNSGERGPLTRAAKESINVDQAKIILTQQEARDQVTDARLRNIAAGYESDIGGPIQDAAGLIDQAQGAIDWETQTAEALLHNQRRNVAEEDVSDVKLPATPAERADQQIRQQAAGTATPNVGPITEVANLADQVQSEIDWEQQGVDARVYNQQRNLTDEGTAETELPATPEERAIQSIRNQAPGTVTTPEQGQKVNSQAEERIADVTSETDWQKQEQAAKLYLQGRNRQHTPEEQAFLVEYEKERELPGTTTAPATAQPEGTAPGLEQQGTLHNRPTKPLTPKEIASLESGVSSSTPGETQAQSVTDAPADSSAQPVMVLHRKKGLDGQVVAQEVDGDTALREVEEDMSLYDKILHCVRS